MGNVEDHSCSGVLRKRSVADGRHIIFTSLYNHKMSSSAISSDLAETSGTHLLSGEVWPKVVFLEELRAKSHTSEVETRSSDLTTHKQIEMGVPEKWQQVFWADESEFEICGSLFARGQN